MTNIPLGGRVSSIFEVAEHIQHIQGQDASVTSFTCEPYDEIRKRKKIAYENTYRMEPPAKFRADQVKQIIEAVLSHRLEGKKYHPVDAAYLCKEIAEEIKSKVKDLRFRRYKIVSVVDIGEKKDQGVSVGSRFLWDADRDNFACSSWSNREMYAIGKVYALYYE